LIQYPLQGLISEQRGRDTRAMQLGPQAVEREGSALIDIRIRAQHASLTACSSSGQLSVYLRLLDVPVPVIYGRSADENPFA